MSVLRRNVVANFAGQGVAVLAGIAFVPLYIAYVGLEAWGLLGFFLSLQALFYVLDLGLAATLNRELARAAHVEDAPPARGRELLRTLEWIYLPMGAVIFAAVWAASGWLAAHWLKLDAIEPQRAARALAMLGLGAALEWPSTLYAAGLRGLDRHVLVNTVRAGVAILRAGGAVIILAFVSPTIEAFAAWQAVVGAAATLAYGMALRRRMPGAPDTARFSVARLREVHALALSLAAISLLAFLVSQSDRLVVSKLLPLATFGGYALAASLAYGLVLLAQPFSQSLFPRYSALVARAAPELPELYHGASQALVVAIAPAAAVLCCFAGPLLRLWTGDAQLAADVATPLALLAAGSALNALMQQPHLLQLAHGWTRPALWQNLLSLPVLWPLLWWGTLHHGTVGAAATWLAYNVAALVVTATVVHRRLLPGGGVHWLLRDLLPPVVAATTVALAIRAVPGADHGWRAVVAIAVAAFLALLASAASAPRVRELLVAYVRRAG